MCSFYQKAKTFSKPQEEFLLYSIGQSRVIRSLHEVRETGKASTLKKKWNHHNWLSTLLCKQPRIRVYRKALSLLVYIYIITHIYIYTHIYIWVQWTWIWNSWTWYTWKSPWNLCKNADTRLWIGRVRFIYLCFEYLPFIKHCFKLFHTIVITK